MHSLDVLAQAYGPLITFAETVDEPAGWTPTQLPGWAVRDLLMHLAFDCQRGLVALATPSQAPPDTDEVSYWTAWRPGTDAGAAHLRGTRIMASAWSSVRGPAELFADTARAVLTAGAGADAASAVRTQGRVLTVEALFHTLAVEATVHHLDTEPVLPERPPANALAAVRHVVDALLGAPAPAGWDDVRCIRLATGRLALTAAERTQLGTLAERFPVFG